MTKEDLLQTLIYPDWPAPERVHAVSTTRRGGVSLPPYDSLNLGYRSGDHRERVDTNRQRLQQALELTAEPAWLKQVHGHSVVRLEQRCSPLQADAACTRTPDQVCVVMTADCLPVLFCDRAGTCVAIAHAGWRGLVRGVVEATLEHMNCDPRQVLVWLGPAIGPEVFEVGEEVRDAFLALDSAHADCFRPSPGGRWLADIYALAERRLQALGVKDIYGGGWCTLTDRERFFSYRRDGHRTGRMASLIWLAG